MTQRFLAWNNFGVQLKKSPSLHRTEGERGDRGPSPLSWSQSNMICVNKLRRNELNLNSVYSLQEEDKHAPGPSWTEVPAADHWPGAQGGRWRGKETRSASCGTRNRSWVNKPAATFPRPQISRDQVDQGSFQLQEVSWKLPAAGGQLGSAHPASNLHLNYWLSILVSVNRSILITFLIKLLLTLYLPFSSLLWWNSERAPSHLGGCISNICIYLWLTDNNSSVVTCYQLLSRGHINHLFNKLQKTVEN